MKLWDEYVGITFEGLLKKYIYDHLDRSHHRIKPSKDGGGFDLISRADNHKVQEAESVEELERIFYKDCDFDRSLSLINLPLIIDPGVGLPDVESIIQSDLTLDLFIGLMYPEYKKQGMCSEQVYLSRELKVSNQLMFDNMFELTGEDVDILDTDKHVIILDESFEICGTKEKHGFACKPWTLLEFIDTLYGPQGNFGQGVQFSRDGLASVNINPYLKYTSDGETIDYAPALTLPCSFSGSAHKEPFLVDIIDYVATKPILVMLLSNITGIDVRKVNTELLKSPQDCQIYNILTLSKSAKIRRDRFNVDWYEEEITFQGVGNQGVVTDIKDSLCDIQDLALTPVTTDARKHCLEFVATKMKPERFSKTMFMRVHCSLLETLIEIYTSMVGGLPSYVLPPESSMVEESV